LRVSARLTAHGERAGPIGLPSDVHVLVRNYWPGGLGGLGGAGGNGGSGGDSLGIDGKG
jgi:hypothetical protein